MNDRLKKERYFLHDLINPLSVAANSLEVLLEQFGDAANHAEVIQKLQPILGALHKATGLVAQRRDHLAETENRNADE